MKKMRIFALILLAVLLASCGAPASDAPTSADTAAVTESSAAVETELTPLLPADLSFDGKSFVFGVVDNPNARNLLVMEEMTGEVLNDAQYSVISSANEALNVSISQHILTNGYPAAGSLIPIIAAGDDAVQVANVYCVDVTTLLVGGYIRNYADIPYIDLEKPWWDSSVNESLTLAGIRYAAIGDLSISTHDLTYCLLFSKKLAGDFGLESPYDLVSSGKWTMDNMAVLAEAVLTDVNGDGVQDENDLYGYLSHTKMALPGFWIGAGEKSIEIDDKGIPYIAMDDERFVNVINKIFAVTWDNGVRYTKASTETPDVPLLYRQMFTSDKSLFLDCSLFWISTLRDMESDFGILPYPKYDEAQDSYHARVSYYMPPVIPVTSADDALVGSVLEEANYLAYRSVKPAYYEISLKGKYSRDEDSEQMLDMIFNSRVIDLGDTLLCAQIRDGFMTTLYKSGKPDLASKLEASRPAIQKTIDDMIAALP